MTDNNNTKRAFDPTKPCRTRDGRPARILATDLKGRYPLVATWGDETTVATFCRDGRHYEDSSKSVLDLINIPVTISKEVTLVLWNTGKVTLGELTFPCANVVASKTLKVTFTEGEGL